MDTNQIATLIEQLQNGNEQQRRSASYKLSKLNDPAIVTSLITAFNDLDSSVRQNAIDGLRNIGSKEALEFLNSHGISTSNINAKANRNKSLRNGFIISIVLMTFVVITNIKSYPNDRELISTWLCGTISFTFIFGIVLTIFSNTRSK